MVPFLAEMIYLVTDAKWLDIISSIMLFSDIIFICRRADLSHESLGASETPLIEPTLTASDITLSIARAFPAKLEASGPSPRNQ